ncbi:Vesicle-mediated ER to Golgi transport protein [Savitreella phatthalungensis]
MSLLSSLAPEKQSVDAAIQVVCDRLEHATLLEDRRAGVLSLKGFAHEYKEQVTAAGLRGLLKSLNIDREDEETLKATLECLLLLFRVRTTGSGTIDDTTLWIADEFTLRPENVLSLLDVCASTNHYVRLQALQVMACVLECRPTQLQDCIMSSADGIGTLVGILDDAREQIKFEALLLLVRLAKGHTDIQKRIAFENALDKVRMIIDDEGGLAGGVPVTDCLLLLHNLVEDNASNQSWFRELELFRFMSSLLQAIDKKDNTAFSRDVVRNVTGSIALVRLFVRRESAERKASQSALMRAGVLTQIVAYSLHASVPVTIRTEALLALADIMDDHAEAQQYLVKASSLVTGTSSDDIFPLLRILLSGQIDDFAMRYAASQCIRSFASGDGDRKLSVVQSMVDSYQAESEGNVLEALLRPVSPDCELDTWFAACTILQLTLADEEAKSMVCGISSAEEGEEPVSIINMVSGNLIIALQRGLIRASAALMMLLSVWLYDSRDNVADFLNEPGTLQALLSALQDETLNLVLSGLTATLISVAYAFDFAEETPVKRATLQPMVLRIGRSRVRRAIHRLSAVEDMYDERTILRTLDPPLLHPSFCDFFRDEYGTIRRSVDQPPLPPLTRQQAETQATEDYIIQLQEQLDFKTNGLNEAISHLRTRQEELTRVRDEVKFLRGKQERDAGEAGKTKEELAAAKAAATESKKQLTTTQEELQKIKDATRRIEGELKVAQDLNEKLQEASGSEASKRSFVEKQLADAHKEKDELVQRLGVLEGKARTSGSRVEVLEAKTAEDDRRLTSLNEELQKAREAKNRAEEVAQSARRQARDLEQELKGAKAELENLQKTHDRDLQLQRERREDAERARDQASGKLSEALAGHDQAIEKAREVASLEADKRVREALDKAKSGAQAAVEVLKKQHLEALQLAQDQSSSELSQARDANTAELSRLRDQHATELARATSALDAAKASHAQELEALESTHAAALENASKTATDSTSETQATTLANLKADHAASLDSLREAHAVEVRELKREHSEVVDREREVGDRKRRAHTGALADLEKRYVEKHEKEIEVLRRDHEREIEKLRAQVDKSKAVARGALEKVKEVEVVEGKEDERVKVLEARVAALEKEKEELAGQLEQTQEDLMLLMDAADDNADE